MTRNTPLGVLGGGWLLALALGAAAGAEAEAPAPPDVVVAWPDDPGFVFEGDKAVLPLTVRAVAAEGEPADVDLSLRADGAPDWRLTRRVRLAPTESIVVPWIIPPDILARASSLQAASTPGDGVAVLRVARLAAWASDAPPFDATLHNTKGSAQSSVSQPVLWAIPRRSERDARRWLPAKTARWAFGFGKVYLLDMQEDIADDPARGRPPVRRFLSSVLHAPERVATTRVPGATVVVALNDADRVFGTPPEEYALTLHALLSLWDSGETTPGRLVLAAPPVPPDDPLRGARYHALAQEVARERAWNFLDAPPPPDAQRLSHARETLLAAARRPGLADVLLIAIPFGAFALATGALAWLRRLSWR